MKRIMVSLILIGLNSLAIYSQETQSADSLAFPTKTWALQFQIGRNFTLNSFQGSIISLKKTLSDKSALRIGVSFGAGTNHYENRYSNVPPDTIHSEFTSNDDEFDFSIVSLYIRHLLFDDNIRGYYGMGSTLGFSFVKNKYKDTHTHGQDFILQKTNLTSNSWYIGAISVFGIEWFVRKNMSLSGEYGATLSYGKTKQVQKNYRSFSEVGSKNKRNSDGFNLRANPVLFGVSVYF